MSFASVTIITACLIIMGSITLLSLNIDALIADLEQQNEVVAFVDESIVDEASAAMFRMCWQQISSPAIRRCRTSCRSMTTA